MTHGLKWFYPPDAAQHFPEAEPAIRIRGAGDDWSVLRYYRVEAENPIPVEMVLFTRLSFAEARRRAETMERYLRGSQATTPPTWD